MTSSTESYSYRSVPVSPNSSIFQQIGKSRHRKSKYYSNPDHDFQSFCGIANYLPKEKKKTKNESTIFERTGIQIVKGKEVQVGDKKMNKERLVMI